MNNKYGIKFIELLLLIAFSIHNICCANDKGFNNGGGERNTMKLPHKYYSPLTKSTYNNIIDNKQMFDQLFIGYVKQYDFDQKGRAIRIEGLRIEPKDVKIGIEFNSINEYSAIYEKKYRDLPHGPDNYKEKKKVFSKNEIDIILNYLERNSDYFFNNKEFEGVNFPLETIVSPNLPSCEHYHYAFSLTIFEPSINDRSRLNHAWVIVKCADKPDPVLQGLIDIFENNFISKFEEQ